jgi:hypothetical protein
MGWWSTSIMGGDTPLDFEDEFFHACNVEKFPEEGGKAELSKDSYHRICYLDVKYVFKAKKVPNKFAWYY